MAARMYSSPKVKIRYSHTASKSRTAGTGADFSAEFEVGYNSDIGYETFRTELCALLDNLHTVAAKWEEAR